MQEWEKKYELLIRWTKDLLTKEKSVLPQIHAAFDPTSQLPEGCPSRASMASMCFGEVREALSEVTHLIDAVDQEIRKRGA